MALPTQIHTALDTIWDAYQAQISGGEQETRASAPIRFTIGAQQWKARIVRKTRGSMPVYLVKVERRV